MYMDIRIRSSRHLRLILPSWGCMTPDTCVIGHANGIYAIPEDQSFQKNLHQHPLQSYSLGKKPSLEAQRTSD